jgi:phage tail-like protein
MDLDGFRKDLTLEVLNEKGHVALRYYLYGCWISDFTAVPDLESSANAVAIESIKIELEGWVRDSSYEEPNVTSPVPQDI